MSSELLIHTNIFQYPNNLRYGLREVQNQHIYENLQDPKVAVRHPDLLDPLPNISQHPIYYYGQHHEMLHHLPHEYLHHSQLNILQHLNDHEM
jgi:hypothetical protein